MNKLYVHIGLSKTATTSLQTHLFNKLPIDLIHYIGVKHPRGQKQSTLYIQFMNYIDNNYGLNLLLRDISRYMKKNKVSLLISEEMITVTVKELSWVDKLSRLGRLLKNFDYEVIVTLREPESALKSFYAERYPYYYNYYNYENINKLISKLDDFNIYFYRILIAELHLNFDKERIKLFFFENFINNGAKEFLDYFNCETIVSNFPIKKENNKNYIEVFCTHNKEGQERKRYNYNFILLIKSYLYKFLPFSASYYKAKFQRRIRLKDNDKFLVKKDSFEKIVISDNRLNESKILYAKLLNLFKRSQM